jgi:flagellar assembly protein FliH
MTRALDLEDFSAAGDARSSGVTAEPVATPDPLPEAELEGGNLDAFEQGYRSGWDDCTAHEVEARRHVGADLATALAEVSLTLDAARDEMMSGLQPLFEQIASQLLPAIVAEAVTPVVVDELRRIAEERCTAVVELLASPETCPVIENLVGATPELAVSVIPEPSMAEGQVALRFENQRRDIDLSTAAAQMSEAIRSFAANMSADPSARATSTTGNGSTSVEPPNQQGVA